MDPVIRRKTLNHLENVYSAVHWKIPGNFLSDEHILDVLENRVNPKSSPGYPYYHDYSTNKDLFDSYRKQSSDGSLSTFIPLVREQIRQYLEVEDFKGDPVRLFVKQEPHKKKKLRDGRVRLIFSVSVIDQVIDHLLLDPSLDAMYDRHHQVPNKVGMSFYNGGTNLFFRYLDDGLKRKHWGSTDKEAYDWTTPIDAYIADEERRNRSCRNKDSEHYELWKRLFHLRNEATYRGLVITSDGRLYAQLTNWCHTCEEGDVETIWGASQHTEESTHLCSNCLHPVVEIGGITRSGGIRTIDMNSWYQVYLKTYHQIEKYGELKYPFKIASMGDDTAENFPQKENVEFALWLRSKGFHPKIEAELTSLQDVEFCSHKFIEVDSRMVPVPLNWNKHAFNLKCNPNGGKYLIDTLFALCIEYAFDDVRFNVLYNLLQDLSNDQEKQIYLRSRQFFQDLVGGVFESGKQTELTESDSNIVCRALKRARTIVPDLLHTAMHSFITVAMG